MPRQNALERPHYPEFMTDVQTITSPDDRNGPDPAKKAALTAAFAQRPEILAKYHVVRCSVCAGVATDSGRDPGESKRLRAKRAQKSCRLLQRARK